MSESAGRPTDMRLLNISQQLYDDLVRDATLWRTRLASYAERDEHDRSWRSSPRSLAKLSPAGPWEPKLDEHGEKMLAPFATPESLGIAPAGPDALAEELDQAAAAWTDYPLLRDVLCKAAARLRSRPARGAVGWIQEHKDGRLSFYAGNIDPRDIHDNGMPTYPVFRDAAMSQQEKRDG